MHIGYLIQQYPPEIGAGPARASEFAARWIDNGARVSVFTALPNRPGGRIFDGYRGRWRMREAVDGVNVTRHWLYASPRSSVLRTLANNLSFVGSSVVGNLRRDDRPDVLIASAPPFFVHIAGWLLARRWRVPLVLEVRDLWPDYLAGMGVVRGSLKDGLFALERTLFRHAHHVITVTETFGRRVVEKGAAADAVTVIPNAVDGDRYFPQRDAAPPLPALGRADREFIVGYLGNIGASQGKLLAVAEAAHRLRDRPDIRFRIAGDGTEGAAFRARVAELRLPNLHISPPIPKTATNAFYNTCDTCLVPLANVPAIQETIPSKLFEIMACERPVIAALGGEAAAVVERSGCGLVCAPEDVDGIVAAVERMRTLSPERRADMGARGRAYVLAHYDRDTLAQHYFRALTGIVQRSARGERALEAAEQLVQPGDAA